MKQPKLSLHDAWRRLDERKQEETLKYFTWTNEHFLLSTSCLPSVYFLKCCFVTPYTLSV
jgi:hypothetical protein